MSPFEPLGRILIFVGILLVLVGALFLLGRHLPFLGNLPGDFSLQRRGVHIFFPIATCVLVSIVLTVIVNLMFRR